MDEKIKALAMALYLELEDQNYQAFCAMLNWMFDLYPESHYYGECMHMMERGDEIVRPVKIRDGLTVGWQVVKMRMKISFTTVK